MSEATLAGARAGDRRAFEHLVDPYRGEIRAVYELTQDPGVGRLRLT